MRAERFDSLRNLLKLHDDEILTFKSFSTFMKLHGWEKCENQSKNLDKTNKIWTLWRIENEELKSEKNLSDIEDFSNYFSKFKSDLNFSTLENNDGLVVYIKSKLNLENIFSTLIFDRKS
jgi:hypothetical protein